MIPPEPSTYGGHPALDTKHGRTSLAPSLAARAAPGLKRLVERGRAGESVNSRSDKGASL